MKHHQHETAPVYYKKIEEVEALAKLVSHDLDGEYSRGADS